MSRFKDSDERICSRARIKTQDDVRTGFEVMWPGHGAFGPGASPVLLIAAALLQLVTALCCNLWCFQNKTKATFLV